MGNNDITLFKNLLNLNEIKCIENYIYNIYTCNGTLINNFPYGCSYEHY